MNRNIVDYYRCPENMVEFRMKGDRSSDQGYFRFGEGIGFGSSCCGRRRSNCKGELEDLAGYADLNGALPALPFDPDEVVDNLRLERYTKSLSDWNTVPLSYLRHLYYLFRPLLPVGIRSHLQRAYASSSRVSFPRWPVDLSVEHILERSLALAMQFQGTDRIPFIWFWPDGASGCIVLTHDVETATGRQWCGRVMDLEEQFGMRSSFQIVPEQRYTVSPDYLENMRGRGFEINVHDLNHDGRLYGNRQRFLERVELINRYGQQFQAQGFRAGVLYRNIEWFGSLRFSYDMSVPNLSNLDPQKGGCCTVMPYFIADLLEIPVTTTQDYSLFYILQSHSLDLWKTQLSMIGKRHGLASFIVHPDYLTEQRKFDVYVQLLSYLAELRDTKNQWIALPGDVNRWWRERSKMKLRRDGNAWKIEGPGSERARLAYAVRDGDGIVLEVENHAVIGI